MGELSFQLGEEGFEPSYTPQWTLSEFRAKEIAGYNPEYCPLCRPNSVLFVKPGSDLIEHECHTKGCLLAPEDQDRRRLVARQPHLESHLKAIKNTYEM